MSWWFDYTSINLLPLMMVGLAALTWWMSMLIAEPPQRQASRQSSVSLRQVLQRPRVGWFFVVQFLLLLSHAPFYSFYSNYLQGYGYNTQTIGLLWSVGVLAEVLMFTQSHRLMAWGTERLLLLSCLALTAVRWGLVGYYPEQLSVQIAAQAIHAFSFALFQSLAMRLIFREFNPDQQGRAKALYSMVWGMGVAFGSLLAGLYWDQFGGSAMFYAAALICVTASLRMWLPVWHSTQAISK